VTASTQITLMAATELLGRFRAGELSPVEAARAALERIEDLNDRVNAFCLVDEEATLADARASEQRWRAGSRRASSMASRCRSRICC
jgi:aspartyl-tRNA(Asn)/glutamyl-tRNA(Gln) amidotransferase subunit A